MKCFGCWESCAVENCPYEDECQEQCLEFDDEEER